MAWDSTKPTSGGLLVSADVRANFAALQQALGGVNLVADPCPLIWPAGDTSAPAHYTLGGAATPTIARAGTGLGDTKRKIGPYCVKLTGGANTGYLQQRLLPPTMDTGFQGITISKGTWVWASAANAARISVYDGTGTTYSAYHTGSSTWEWLTVTVTISGAATELSLRWEVATAAVGYFSGLTGVLGPVPPTGFIPAPVVDRTERLYLAGAQAIVNNKVGGTITWSRPTLIRGVWLIGHTAPTTTALTARPNHYDGAAFQPIFSTSPTMAAAATVGNKQAPDGTYRYRCFTGFNNSITDALMNLDWTSVGSGGAAADIYYHIQYLQFARPLESFLAHSDIN